MIQETRATMRKPRHVSWQGNPIKALNSKLVSAAMAASLFSFALLRTTAKSEPLISHFVFL
ncbi:hypothetical protein EJD97_002303, partial [Solanum chilense]